MSALAAFQDSRVLTTFGYMWKSSVCACEPREILMGTFLMGLIMLPLTARGVMVDGRRLCGYSWSWCKRVVPAT